MSRYTFVSDDGEVLFQINSDGTVEGTLDGAGDAGRVFMRSIQNQLYDLVTEAARPRRAADVERIYDALGYEAELRRKLDNPEKYLPGLAIARRMVIEHHPDGEWRRTH